MLAIRFLPLSYRVVTVPEGLSLEAMLDAFVRGYRGPSGAGVLALFTEARIPNRRQGGKLGVAQFLGRAMAVRLPPGVRESRVLLHEILHLFGAIHVTDEIDP